MPRRLLTCPGCGRLVHAARLQELAARAEACARDGRVGEAVLAWREALTLLPHGSPQAQQVGERVDALLARPEARNDPALRRAASDSGWSGWAGLGLAGVLLAGLTKLPALAGLLGMFGIFWAAFGWKVGAGVLVSLYIHELGHVLAMWRRGLTVTAPMFVPGLGAYVRMTERPASPVEDNRIGLAGPVAGLAVAVVAWVAGTWLEMPLLVAVARLGAMLNLFNLLPVWQLDGARGFASLVRWQRVAIAAALLIAFGLTREGVLLLVGVVAAAVALGGRPSAKPDHAGFATFLVLVITLSAIAAADVPGLASR